MTLAEAQADRTFWGRLVESAVGAHVAKAAATGDCSAYYWRERNREVDFIVRSGKKLVALEVKSGCAADARAGTSAFSEVFRPTRKLLVGGDGIDVETFLLKPVEDWLKP